MTGPRLCLVLLIVVFVIIIINLYVYVLVDDSRLLVVESSTPTSQSVASTAGSVVKIPAVGPALTRTRARSWPTALQALGQPVERRPKTEQLSSPLKEEEVPVAVTGRRPPLGQREVPKGYVTLDSTKRMNHIFNRIAKYVRLNRSMEVFSQELFSHIKKALFSHVELFSQKVRSYSLTRGSYSPTP